MATASEAPATMAEGPTTHTPNQNTYGYTREQQIEALRKLRAPFDPKEIRFLPRIWCKACKDSRGQGCNRHSFAKCSKCKQRMPQDGHLDLQFVGHAEATNRLLNVDPFWDWEPLTVDERGLPQVDGYRGLWIRLTVCGMTRLGYGHAGDKTGGDAVKEVIGDAIRNAGMRFGMALDLWTSSDLIILESGEAPETGTTQPQKPAAADSPFERLKAQVRKGWDNQVALIDIRRDAKKQGFDDQPVHGPGGTEITFDQLLSDRIDQLSQQPKADAA
ncbi:hypothetical protein [Streptomyces koyangensis]|uniref:hypothetical protein n=1 Tax=Streptomyces koyangensis TaxID=188770 RepID=UPI003BF59672